MTIILIIVSIDKILNKPIGKRVNEKEAGRNGKKTISFLF